MEERGWGRSRLAQGGGRGLFIAFPTKYDRWGLPRPDNPATTGADNPSFQNIAVGTLFGPDNPAMLKYPAKFPAQYREYATLWLL